MDEPLDESPEAEEDEGDQEPLHKAGFMCASQVNPTRLEAVRHSWNTTHFNRN